MRCTTARSSQLAGLRFDACAATQHGHLDNWHGQLAAVARTRCSHKLYAQVSTQTHLLLLLRLLLQVVGIDKSPSQAAKAAARHQGIANLSFAQVDGYDLAAVRRLADAAGIRQFSVIFIDVSGR